MAARVLDGQALAARLQEEIKPRVAEFVSTYGRPPGLGIVLVGSDPASQVYVRHKVKAGGEVGFRVDLEQMPETASLTDVLALVGRLNQSPVHDGILVQSPLPKAMGAGAQQHIFDTIAAEKDVDGFGAESVGLLSQNRPKLVACTPAGIIELLEREQIPIRGRHAVVIGRSDIVGKPMAMLLLHRDATVTICHSRTPDLPAVCRQADILVAACRRSPAESIGNFVLIAGALTLFNGFFITLMAYMTEFGVTTEVTAKWHEIGVTPEDADALGLRVLGIGLVVFIVGVVLRAVSRKRTS